MARLKACWNSARSGQGRVVLLAGEAGQGKTSLLNEFLVWARASDKSCKIARAACSAQSGRDEPFWPFADVMAQLVSSKVKSVGENVLDALLDLAPSWASVIPVAGNVVGASIKTAQVVRAHTRVNDMPSPDKLMREYASALAREAGKQPILVFIDDLHWSDAASVRLLSHLSRQVSGMRVMIVVAYRTSDVALEGHPLRELINEILRYDAEAEIQLPPLTLEGVRALVRRLYPANKFPDSLGAALHDNTGGSPFFVIESLRLMQSRGELVKDAADGRWMMGRDLADDDLPRNVEAVIRKRLERLPPELQSALAQAAAQGAVFETAVLAHVLGMDELAVMRLIEPAEKTHDLIDYAGDLELDHDVTARYRFTSTMIQRELLETLRAKHRLLVHRRTAEGIEKLWGDDAIDYAPQLMRLYEIGKVWERAAFYALAAAKQARAAGAVPQAIAQYEHAEQLLKRSIAADPAMQFEIDEGLSFLYEIDSSYDRADDRARRALRAGRDQLGWPRYATLQMRLATLADAAGQFSREHDILQETLACLDPASPDAASPQAFQARGQFTRALARTSRADEAIRYAEATLAEMERLPQTDAHRAARIRVLNHLGLALMSAGDYPRALALYQDIRRSTRQMNLMDVLSLILINLSNLHLMLGQYDQVRDIIGDMVEVGNQISSESLLAHARLTAGKSQVYQAKPYAALCQLEQAEKIAAQLRFFAGQPELLAYKALALVRLGRPGDAKALLDASEATAAASGSREWVALVASIEAERWLALGEPLKALPLAEDAIVVFQEEGARFYEATTHRLRGHILKRLGRIKPASQAYQRAGEIFTALGNTGQVARTLQEADLLL
jgi:tetratricopeptide (TPR) repeat protein